MTGFWDAVASAGPYANNMNLAANRQPQQHFISRFLQAGDAQPTVSKHGRQLQDIWKKRIKRLGSLRRSTTKVSNSAAGSGRSSD